YDPSRPPRHGSSRSQNTSRNLVTAPAPPVVARARAPPTTARRLEPIERRSVVEEPPIGEIRAPDSWRARLSITSWNRTEELAGLQCRVVNSREIRLILGIARLQAREVLHVAGRPEDDVHALHAGDVEGIRHADRRLNLLDHQHVVVDRLPVIDAVDAPN